MWRRGAPCRRSSRMSSDRASPVCSPYLLRLHPLGSLGSGEGHMTSRGPWRVGPGPCIKVYRLLTSRGPWLMGSGAQHKCVYLLISRGPWHTGPRAPRKWLFLLIPPGTLACGPPGPA
jgi:hypothetical protein